MFASKLMVCVDCEPHVIAGTDLKTVEAFSAS